MNIFKILASGDGSINEPNVSAFLGYLLNPKADHGIGDELLRKVLFNLYLTNKNSSLKNFLVDKNELVRNLSTNSNFNIEVLLEQAFKDQSDKKEIVDIVLLCFEKKVQPKESLAKIVLSSDNRGELKQIFLIENKIKDSSVKARQIRNQCTSTISTLSKVLEKSEDEIKKVLSIIFISPDAEKSNIEYEELANDISVNIPKVQIHWTTKLEDDENDDTDNISIISCLRKILIDETKSLIEPINEQTKFTIKSFISFVENDFKSTIEEELEGEIVKDIDYDFSTFRDKKKDLFTSKSWELITNFLTQLNNFYPNLVARHSSTHPISVFNEGLNGKKVGKKIMSLSRTGRTICIKLMNRNYSFSDEQKLNFKTFLNQLYDIEVKDEAGRMVLKFKQISSENIYYIYLRDFIS